MSILELNTVMGERRGREKKSLSYTNNHFYVLSPQYLDLFIKQYPLVVFILFIFVRVYIYEHLKRIKYPLPHENFLRLISNFRNSK